MLDNICGANPFGDGAMVVCMELKGCDHPLLEIGKVYKIKGNAWAGGIKNLVNLEDIEGYFDKNRFQLFREIFEEVESRLTKQLTDISYKLKSNRDNFDGAIIDEYGYDMADCLEDFYDRPFNLLTIGEIQSQAPLLRIQAKKNAKEAAAKTRRTAKYVTLTHQETGEVKRILNPYRVPYIERRQEESLFQLGDVVRCIEDGGRGPASCPVKAGELYNVTKVSGHENSQFHMIGMKERVGDFFAKRFELVSFDDYPEHAPVDLFQPGDLVWCIGEGGHTNPVYLGDVYTVTEYKEYGKYRQTMIRVAEKPVLFYANRFELLTFEDYHSLFGPIDAFQPGDLIRYSEDYTCMHSPHVNFHPYGLDEVFTVTKFKKSDGGIDKIFIEDWGYSVFTSNFRLLTFDEYQAAALFPTVFYKNTEHAYD